MTLFLWPPASYTYWISFIVPSLFPQENIVFRAGISAVFPPQGSAHGRGGAGPGIACQARGAGDEGDGPRACTCRGAAGNRGEQGAWHQSSIAYCRNRENGEE